MGAGFAARRAARVAIVVAGAVLAASPPAQGSSEEDALRKGRQAAAVFTDALEGKLLASMKGLGPAGAMRVYVYQIQALAGEIEARNGVEIRRTSLRLRNPANAPDPAEREILERFASQVLSGGFMSEDMVKRRRGGKAVWYYARPVVLSGVCAPCHGTSGEIPEDVTEFLLQRYPGDNAAGYGPGALLGIVSVVVPAE